MGSDFLEENIHLISLDNYEYRKGFFFLQVLEI